MTHLKNILIALTLCSCGQTNSGRELKMDLSGQNLTEIPDSVFQNTEITFLNLGSKDIQFYPPLSGLVDSNANRISILPNKIGRLTKLRTLILNTNMLTMLPDSIVYLESLEELDLSINKDLNILQELEKIRRLPKLKMLKIVDVKMTSNDLSAIDEALDQDVKVVATVSDYRKTEE